MADKQPERPDPQNDPNLVRAYDKYGREIYLTKEDWRTKVLPGTLQSQWDEPDRLYGTIVGALQDGFRADVMAAAEHLYLIDPQPMRGAALWGVALMGEGRLDEAEAVFDKFVREHGENGIILTNLAKVFAERGNHARAEEILWHALELDPNQENGMGWYIAIWRERGGDTGAVEARRRIAALPGSWRARLWLARDALRSGQLAAAFELYRECLSHLPPPLPADLLMQMSGDLGNAGQLSELLQLCAPHFIAEVHGLQVGNNLIKANLDLGRIEEARRICDTLYALKRPDWRQTLDYWDTQIARARLQPAHATGAAPLEVTMLAIDGPIWLGPSSPAAVLFRIKAAKAATIAFFGSSAEGGSSSDKIEHQLADERGRLSRALPLFLAEQIYFNTDAGVQTLIPRIAGPSSGFVLSGAAWTDTAAADWARQSRTPPDLLVTTHLKCGSDPWTLELRLVRVTDSQCIGKLTTPVAHLRPQESVPQFSGLLLDLLRKQAGLEASPPSPPCEAPAGSYFSDYLLRLEQLLAVFSAALDGPQTASLHGERDIVDGNIALCLGCPDSVVTRLVLARTLAEMKKIRPAVVAEFRDKVVMLQSDCPLSEPARDIVQSLFDQIFGT